jgi:predicted MFS family arabinose efflux permease
LGVISAITAALMPVLVAVWSEQFGLPLGQASFLASTGLAMQAVGTVGFIWVSRFVSWRLCAFVGVSILVIGNLFTALSTLFAALAVAQAVAGLGGGLLRALCMSCLAKAGKPSRAFSLYAVGQMLCGAAGTAVIPQLVAAGGGRAVFLALASVSGLGFAALIRLPAARFATAEKIVRAKSLPAFALIALFALFVYFLGQGALWTFMPKIGSSQNLSNSTVVTALAYSNIAGLAGALGVGIVGVRLNHAFALIVLLLLGLLSLAGIYLGHTPNLYSASVCSFYFAWCASFPFQFALIARADPTTSANVLVPAIDAFGLACGPAMAASLLPFLGLAAPAWLYATAGVVSILLFVICSFATARR